MTIKNRADIKTKFETGDVPTQQDFYDFIDSMLNKLDDVSVLIPALTGNEGKYLTNDGNAVSWHDLNSDYLRYASSGVVGAVPTFNAVGLDITVGSCVVSLYNNPSFVGLASSYTIAGDTLTCVDNSMNYVVVDYNSGTPIYKVITDRALVNESDVIPINTILATQGFLHLSHWDSVGSGLSNKIHHRLVNTQRHVRESGLSLTMDVGGNIIIGEGIVWRGARDFTLAPVNSDTSGNSQWFNYHTVNSVWTSTYNPTPAYNNTHYDNRTNLIPLTNNKYTINWIFRGVEDHNHGYMIIGDKEYADLPTAHAETKIPSLPPLANLHAILVGRIIFKKGVAVPAAIENAFDGEFIGTVINDHNQLSSIQGGTTNEYYHLTSADYTDKILNRKFGTGSDYAQFSSTGFLRMYGAATAWVDLLPTAVYTPIGATAPNITVYAGATTLKCQEFPNASGSEEFNPTFQIPHEWVEGSTIHPHLHLAIPNDAVGGTITMSFTYQWSDVSEVGVINETTLTGNLVVGANAGIQHNAVFAFGTIDGTGKLISSIISARITRDANDTFQSSIWLKSADIHVEVNTMGSDLILVK